MNRLDINCRISNFQPWSYSRYWHNDYTDAFIEGEEDTNFYLRVAKFCNCFGFDCASVSVDHLTSLSQQHRDEILDYFNKKELSFHPSIDGKEIINFTPETAEEYGKYLEEKLTELSSFYRNKNVTCSLYSGTRFDTDIDLETRIQKIIENLAPIVKHVTDAGYRFAVENGGDFYCSEIVRMCQSVPNLYMLLDTGNPFLIGEDPIAAYYTAAPYTIAVHFRDVKVCPDPRSQVIRLIPAALGEGNVPLRECIEILQAHCPDPLTLMFETELSPEIAESPWLALKKEIEYINSLQE